MQLSLLPLNARHVAVWAIASAEQVIGTALSTVAGVIIPMLALIMAPEGLSSWLQGVIGAADLVGIAIGSAVIGRLSDREGYLRWFRLCPLLITMASVVAWLVPDVWVLVLCLFVTGIGVGGGYTLDEAYVSELMPRHWRTTMVGAAKATCSLGFIGAAVVAYFIIKGRPQAQIWPCMMLIPGALALLTLLLRLRWWGAPEWLLLHGRGRQALKAAQHFFGPQTTLDTTQKGSPPSDTSQVRPTASFADRVIFAGVPWACESFGVYGIGVFLPVLVMVLGLESPSTHGMLRVEHSVLLTAIINAAILPGFAVGLWLLRRMTPLRMLVQGFVACAAGLALLLAAYILHWPVWVSIAGFLIFELFLNMGPHLVTFVIPARIFAVNERATGTGIATTMGKTGSVLGVFAMPLLLQWGGGVLVLAVCLAIMLLGALLGALFGHRVVP